jgi:nicotinamidase-related amidase
LTTLPDRPNSALVVIDVQNEVVANAHQRDAVIANIGRLVVTGAQTDACIRSTIHGAFTRGCDTVLVSDVHTTEDYSDYGLPPADKVIAPNNQYWRWHGGPGREAEMVEAAEVSFRP